MSVVHGQIDDVFGDVRWDGDIGLVNAAVSLSGNGYSLEFPLAEFDELTLSPFVSVPVENGWEAVWLFGRIKALFGDWIELDDGGEKSIMHIGFAAYLKASDQWIPFMLTDHYLRGYLCFSETLTDDSIKRRVAASLYRLLLTDPEDVVDFWFRKVHSGAPVTMVGGITDGELQYDEEEDL